MIRFFSNSHVTFVTMLVISLTGCDNAGTKGIDGCSSTDTSSADSLCDSDAQLDTWQPEQDSRLSALWANSGEDKVAKEELRGSAENPQIESAVFDGTTVRLSAARNEVVAFNTVLEAATETVSDIEVKIDGLSGPQGYTISSTPASGDGVFDWTSRNIELFYIRYLKIKGLSRYDTYDERIIPERFRRPWSGRGQALPGTGWADRPDADKHYPDIAVPLEVVGSFDVAAGTSQSIWTDIYVPKDAPAGIYRGRLVISEGGNKTASLPIALNVRRFTLPDRPSLTTLLFMSSSNVNRRFLGEDHPGSAEEIEIADRHYQVARRHRINLTQISGTTGVMGVDEPDIEWFPRLDGTLFSAALGYAGPSTGIGLDIFCIGAYSSWAWKGEDTASMQSHVDGWESFFQREFPNTERFLYLMDESTDYPQIEKWASDMRASPGPGADLLSFATMSLLDAPDNTPSLSIPCSNDFLRAPARTWQMLADEYSGAKDKRLCRYNGRRPFSGVFYTEGDGVELIATAWAQFKKKVDLWFYWESTFYFNYATHQDTNVFAQAQTWGGTVTGVDEVLGEQGPGYANGNGVLFYPGTDTVFPQESYGLMGPLASVRLKLWRRGIQDGDYLALAQKVAPQRVDEILQQRVPRVLWEVEADNPDDPSYVHTDISWSTNPDDWQAARAELADIIEGK